MSESPETTKPRMSLSESRAVNWPFNEINRPIGQVLDDRTITIRDLAWASQSAYDLRVKEAARSIMLYALHGEGVGSPLNIVIASRYLERMERTDRLVAGIMFGAAGAYVPVVVLAIIQGANRLIQQAKSSPLEIIVAAIIVAAIILVPFLALMLLQAFGYLRSASAYQTGRWGEEKTVNQLAAHLDGHWTLYRNFQWPNGRGGDIDLLLVGPGGVWVLEVKALSGEVRNVEYRWEKRGRWGWRRLSGHPGKQAAKNAARLKEYLVLQGLNIRWVDKAIVWAKTENDPLEKPGSLALIRPEIAVWKLDTFAEQVDALWTGRNHLNDQQIKQANEIMTQAIENRKGRKK